MSPTTTLPGTCHKAAKKRRWVNSTKQVRDFCGLKVALSPSHWFPFSAVTHSFAPSGAEATCLSEKATCHLFRNSKALRYWSQLSHLLWFCTRVMSSAPVFQNSKLEDCKDNCFLHHIVLTPTLMTTADYHITQTSQMENIVSNCYFHYFPKEHPHTLVLITPSHPATLLNSLNSLFP